MSRPSWGWQLAQQDKAPTAGRKQLWVLHVWGRMLEAGKECSGLDLFLQEEGEVQRQLEAVQKGMAMGHKGKHLALGGGSPSLELNKTRLCKALWDPVCYWGQPRSGWQHGLEIS